MSERLLRASLARAWYLSYLWFVGEIENDMRDETARRAGPRSRGKCSTHRRRPFKTPFASGSWPFGSTATCKLWPS